MQIEDSVDVHIRLPVAVVNQLRRRALELTEAGRKLRTWGGLAREALIAAVEADRRLEARANKFRETALLAEVSLDEARAAGDGDRVVHNSLLLERAEAQVKELEDQRLAGLGGKK